MTSGPFNLTGRGMAVFLAVAGVFIIIEALTKSHFANEEGGTARATEQERYRATPKRRVIGVGLGLICIIVGALLFFH